MNYMAMGNITYDQDKNHRNGASASKRALTPNKANHSQQYTYSNQKKNPFNKLSHYRNPLAA